MQRIDANIFLLKEEPVTGSKLYWLYIIELYLNKAGAEMDYSNIDLVNEDELISSRYYEALCLVNRKGYLDLPMYNFLPLNIRESLVTNKYLLEYKQDFEDYFRGTQKSENSYFLDINQAYLDLVNKFIGITLDTLQYFVLHVLAMYLVEEILRGNMTSLVLDIEKLQGNNLVHFTLLYLILDMLPDSIPVSLIGLSRESEVFLGLRAWTTEMKDRGFLSDDYVSKDEKIDFVNKSKNYYDGAVVYCYERSVSFASASKAPILDCKLAIIRSISDKGITIQSVPSNVTRSQLEYDFNQLPPSVLELYNYEYPTPHFTTEFLEWSTLGIEFLMQDELHILQERYFLMPLQRKGEGLVTQKVEMPNHDVIDKSMSYNEAVYRILTENDLLFNKEQFKELYLTDNEKIEINNEEIN